MICLQLLLTRNCLQHLQIMPISHSTVVSATVLILKHNGLITILCEYRSWDENSWSIDTSIDKICDLKIKTKQHYPSVNHTLASSDKIVEFDTPSLQVVVKFTIQKHSSSNGSSSRSDRSRSRSPSWLTLFWESDCILVSVLSSLYPSIHRYHLGYALCSSFTPSLLCLLWHNSLFALLFNSLPFSLSPRVRSLLVLVRACCDKVICERSELS